MLSIGVSLGDGAIRDGIAAFPEERGHSHAQAGIATTWGISRFRPAWRAGSLPSAGWKLLKSLPGPAVQQEQRLKKPSYASDWALPAGAGAAHPRAV